MMNRHGAYPGHNNPGYPTSPADYFIAVYKNGMGTPGEANPRTGGQSLELKEKKPGQKLGFSAVGVTEGDNTPAFSLQRSLKNVKKGLFPPQKHPGHTVKKEKVEPAKYPDEEYSQF
jgi:hypothetical protein